MKLFKKKKHLLKIKYPLFFYLVLGFGIIFSVYSVSHTGAYSDKFSTIRLFILSVALAAALLFVPYHILVDEEGVKVNELSTFYRKIPFSQIRRIGFSHTQIFIYLKNNRVIEISSLFIDDDKEQELISIVTSHLGGENPH